MRKFVGRARAAVATASAVGLIGAMAAFSPAAAQAPGCEKIKTLLDARKNLVGSIQKMSGGGKKKMDAKQACSAFGRLVNNGGETIKWAEANKAWCQIPDQFITGIKADNAKASDIRGKACKVAAQQVEMEKRARQAAAAQQAGGGGPQGGGMLGGPGLTGQMKIPAGAL